MANELKHKLVGPILDQLEYEGIDAHVLNNQSVGDLIWAASVTQLERLPIGNEGDSLVVVSGKPAWGAGAPAGLPLKRNYTAGENITDGDLVYISGNDTVKKPASVSHLSKVIGIADETKLSSQSISIVVFGPKVVTAGGTVIAGDSVKASSSGDGRAVAASVGHVHNVVLEASSKYDVGSSLHTHSDTTGTESNSVTVGHANHGHVVAFTSSAAVDVADDDHTHPVDGNPTQKVFTGSQTHTHPVDNNPDSLASVAAINHQDHVPSPVDEQIIIGSNTHGHGSSGEPSSHAEPASGTHSHGATAKPNEADKSVADQGHTHNTGPAGSQTTVAAENHTHSVSTGGPSGTRSVARGTHTHGDVSSTDVLSEILGKAENGATVGNTFTMFVTHSA